MEDYSSRTKHSVDLLVVYDKDIDFDYFVLHVLTAEFAVDLNDVVVDVDHRVMEKVALTVFAEITEKHFLLYWTPCWGVLQFCYGRTENEKVVD